MNTSKPKNKKVKQKMPKSIKVPITNPLSLNNADSSFSEIMDMELARQLHIERVSFYFLPSIYHFYFFPSKCIKKITLFEITITTICNIISILVYFLIILLIKRNYFYFLKCRCVNFSLLCCMQILKYWGLKTFSKVIKLDKLRLSF